MLVFRKNGEGEYWQKPAATIKHKSYSSRPLKIITLSDFIGNY